MSETIGKFRSLSPSNDALDVDNYVEFLHSVATDNTKNTDFGNIALTGDIGIGKSSIVRTYEKKYNYKFVYITAGDLGYRFERDEITGLPRLPKKKSECSLDKESQEEVDNEQTEDVESQQNEGDSLQNNLQDKPENTVDLKDEEAEKLSEEIQQKLEKNLLEQLIALCKSNDIPRSRFQTVPENAANKKLWLSFYPIFCIIAVFCGFKLIANNFIKKDYLNFIDLEPFMWLILIIFISSSIGIAVRKLITHYKFTKLSLNVGKEDTGSASAEIDMDESENASLDTNLHEIIYIFEQLAEKKSSENEERPPVFVIEDVDRYPAEICFPILTKFKQINDMLNSRYRLNHSGYGKHYKFIYTLNDKIFDDSQGGRCVSDNDPYKFFDVIIPVIPKLSFANSLSILKNDFKKYNIDEGFFKKISSYIYDFRKLRDIENEFIVYYDKFANNLSSTALLAFVMYKIFYKRKYYELFKTDKKGVPQSKLLKKVLYGSKEIVTDGGLEELLVSRFDDKLEIILDMSQFVRKIYLENMIRSGEKEDWSRRDLSNLDLNGSELKRFIFVNTALKKTILCIANLEKANLEGANLNYANLEGANLKEANLNSSNLEGAKINAAMLNGTKLNKANLQRAELNDAYLERAELNSANLERANLNSANLEGANLNEANLNGVNFVDAELKEANLNWAKLNDANLERAELNNANLEGANLNGALLRETKLFAANLNGATLMGTKFFGAKLNGANLNEANLEGANLEGAKLNGAELNGAMLNNILQDETTVWRNAKYNDNTVFPENFSPEEHGMIEVDVFGRPVKKSETENE